MTPRTNVHRTRPETQQNLIHTDKEQHDRSRAIDQTAQTHAWDALPRHMFTPNSNIPRYRPILAQPTKTPPSTRTRPAERLSSFDDKPAFRCATRIPAGESRPQRNAWHETRGNDGRHEAAERVAPRWKTNTGGGDNRDRTDDPLLAKQVLSQLSYAPNKGTHLLRTTGSSDPSSPGRKHHRSKTPYWWAREDLNLRPHAYQACALTS